MEQRNSHLGQHERSSPKATASEVQGKYRWVSI